MTLRVAVTGATGRMGREVLAAADERADCEVVAAVSSSAEDDVAGHEVHPDSALVRLLDGRDADAVVDFTVPEASVDYAAAAAEARVAYVCGTTGFSEEELSAVRAAADDVPVLKAANFARGVQALLGVVREAVADLPGYDVELVETHHNGKRDAPSGTAKRLLREIEDGREEATRRVHGREGDAPRQQGDVGVHALRAGDITGEHEILLANNHEELRLTHRAESRGVFAAGALDAAAWLAGRDPGWYDFAAVLAGGESEGIAPTQRGDDE